MLNLNESQRSCMTKYTREHFAGIKNPSNDPAPKGLKELSKVAKRKWQEKNEVKKRISNGND